MGVSNKGILSGYSVPTPERWLPEGTIDPPPDDGVAFKIDFSGVDLNFDPCSVRRAWTWGVVLDGADRGI